MSSTEQSTTKSTHFISDVPCKRGHIGLRYKSNGGCVECTKTENRTKARARWRTKNISHVHEQDKEYAKKNAERIRQYHKVRYLTQEKPKQQTPEFKAKRSEYRKQLYTKTKQQRLQQTFEYFKTLDLPSLPEIFTENAFEIYVMWMLMKHFDVPIDDQFMLPTTRRLIDLYIPSFQIGIEVKIESANWTKKKIQTQVTRYEEILGKGNVYVVSPLGKYQHTLTSLIAELQSRFEKLQESPIELPS